MLRQRGFSLIEMMVATALALLTGLAVFPVLTIGIQRLLDAAINASGG